jgi:hypothetical protein
MNGYSVWHESSLETQGRRFSKSTLIMRTERNYNGFKGKRRYDILGAGIKKGNGWLLKQSNNSLGNRSANIAREWLRALTFLIYSNCYFDNGPPLLHSHYRTHARNTIVFELTRRPALVPRSLIIS